MEKLINKIRSTKFRILLTIFGVLIAPAIALAVVMNLNGAVGQNQTFQNDSNITISTSPSTNTHTLGWSGTLPVSRGGTGASSFTAGSILFSNGTVITQDNSNLFWNDTTNALTIGGNLTAGNLSGTNTGDQDLSGLVPYTGATTDVILGGHELIVGVATRQIELGTTPGTDTIVDIFTDLVTLGAVINLERTQGDFTNSIFSYRTSEVLGKENMGIVARNDIVFATGQGMETMRISDTGLLTFGGAIQAVLDTSSLTTSDKTFTLPDASGTFGLLEVDQTWGG